MNAMPKPQKKPSLQSQIDTLNARLDEMEKSAKPAVNADEIREKIDAAAQAAVEQIRKSIPAWQVNHATAQGGENDRLGAVISKMERLAHEVKADREMKDISIHRLAESNEDLLHRAETSEAILSAAVDFMQDVDTFLAAYGTAAGVFRKKDRDMALLGSWSDQADPKLLKFKVEALERKVDALMKLASNLNRTSARLAAKNRERTTV
jgi:hypothetical protein